MLNRLTSTIIILIVVSTTCEGIITYSESYLNNSTKARNILLDNGLSRTFKHIYAQCAESEDVFWCTKVQATKLLGRALKVQNINIIDGFTIVKKSDFNDSSQLQLHGRAKTGDELNLNNRDIENLSMKSLDALLFERFYQFLQSRQIQISLPRMLAFGQRSNKNLLQNIMQFVMSLLTGESENVANDNASSLHHEGRGKKKDDKKYLGPFIAAVMLKAAILKMAYHSIAILAGKALIVGKIALIISAIIGLKKLVSSDGGEKTTYEIVKHPQVQQSHTYSSSHSGEYEGGSHESGGGGAYHRSIDDEMMMQDKAYHAWVPTTKIS